MTEAEKLIRGIELLRETIRREWFNIGTVKFTGAPRSFNFC